MLSRFQYRLSCFVTCGLILICKSTALTAERISNGGFTTLLVNGYPDDWEFYFPASPAGSPIQKAALSCFTVENGTGQEGFNSLRISSGVPVRGALLQRSIPAQSGEAFRFSVWMKAEKLDEGPDTGARARVLFFNSKQRDKNPQLVAHTLTLRAPKATFDWQQLSAEGTVPADADTMQVELYLWRGTGTVWFAKPSLDIISGENSTPLPDRASHFRYKSANKSLIEIPKNGPRVIFLGDSITDQWNLQTSFPGENFVNRGIAGQLTWQMLSRLRQDVLDLKPDVVSILGGTNDIGGGLPVEIIATNIRAMAQACGKENIRVIVCSVLPVTDYLATKERPNLIRTVKRPPATIVELNGILKQMVATEGVIFVNLHDALANADGFLPTDLTVDGLHLNPKGYAVITPLVLKAVRSSLAEKPAAP